jgi:pyruvate formate lyase activating enzyme
VYDHIITTHVDPIEKKPMYHVLPGSYSYSLATVGCNFQCRHCQNADISQMPRDHPGHIPGSAIVPEDLVKKTLQSGSTSIAYTYTEPTVYFELAYDTARLANQQGLKNVFVTNGYMTREALEMISPYLDAANVDLKGFDDAKYRHVCGAKLEPVKEAIQTMRELDIWVEVTTLIIPEYNDTERELQQIAEWLCSVDPAMPWHVSAFYPRYRMTDRPPTSAESIFQAVALGKQAGLQHVYSGNIRGGDFEHTWCPQCGTCLIKRTGYMIADNRINNGACPECATPVAGIW